MNNIVSIKVNNKTKITNNVRDFLNPDNVYIPMAPGMELNVETNAQIYKEEILLKNKDKYVYSPISGKVLGATESMKSNGESTKCIVIENDFKEKLNKRKIAVKYINEYSKSQLAELIDKYNALDKPLDMTAKTLLINGIDIDPFEKTSSYIIDNYSSKLLETIDALASILEIENTIFAINNNDTQNVINLTNNIGTYPNINLKLMPDIYPMGFEYLLKKNTISKKQEQQGVIYLTVQDVYCIYNVLRSRKAITERLVTVAGNAIENPCVVNVKIGTSLSEIIRTCCSVSDNTYYVVVNGLIAGKTLESLNDVVTTKTRSIFLNTIDTSKEKDVLTVDFVIQNVLSA